MRRPGKILIGIVALAVSAGCARAAPTAGEDCSASAQTFWQSFRQAVASGDPARLAALSRFPVQVEGTLDEAGVPLAKAEFESRATGLLAADTGLREEAYSQRQLVADTAQAPDVRCTPSAGAFRVGNMVFERFAGEWQLVKIYVD